MVSTLTARNSQINFSSKHRNIIYSVVSKQSVPSTGSFSFKEDYFSLLINVFWHVTKSWNCSSHVTSRSIVVSFNLSRHVKHLYRFDLTPVKSVCSDNVSKQNVCNVSSFSKPVKPLTVSKPVCLRIVLKYFCLTSVQLTHQITKIQ